ncbi:MAG: Ig-like domain-containing protein [Clostridiales bacterium]|nr:Ig-like domain-containing protein [Clostridiales bacterium]
MKKRTFKLVAIAVLVVLCMLATTVIAACNKQSTYYLSTQSDGWTTYDKGDAVPDSVKFTVDGDGTYNLTVDLEEGDQFAIYQAGSTDNLVKSIFGSGNLSLVSGKVVVGATGKYELNIDLGNGELSYRFTPAQSGPVAVTGVSLSPKTLVLTAGGATGTLTATVAPANATNKNVTWSSNHEEIATVANGVVTPVAEGTATITVTTVDGNHTDTCEVTVNPAQSGPVAVTGVTIEESNVRMTVGDADVTLTAVVAPANATNKNVSWSSSVPGVATVDNNGKVHAVAEGDTVITVKTEDGNFEATCNVHVSAASDPTVDVEDIWFDDSSLTIMVGEEQTVDVTVYPDEATDKTFTWEVVEGDKDVVTIEIVDGGLKVTGVKAGTVTIKVVSHSNPEVESDNFTITVNPLAAESFTVNPESLELENGGEADLAVTILPAGATATVLFTSNDTSVVTVDSSTGHVTAVAGGKTTITVKVGNLPSVEIPVTVAKHVESISLSVNSATIYGLGSTRDITVVFNPTDTTDTEFTISATNSGIVSWQISGSTITVTAVAAGSTKLTVTSTYGDGAIYAECSITVSEQEPVPSLDYEELTLLELGTVRTVSIIYSGSETLSFSVSSNASATVAVEKSSTGNTFTVTSAGFGTATITVSVSYGSKSVSLSLTVGVESEYFWLSGSMNNWPATADKDTVEAANLLLTDNGDGTWSLTRDFNAGDKFYIQPKGGWDGGALTSDYYTATSSSASTYSITYDAPNNIKLGVTGNYTVTLKLTGNKASWTIVGNWIAPTSAQVTSDNVSLTAGDEVDTANFTLTISPSGAKADADNIVWSVSSHDGIDLVLTESNENRSYAMKLVSFSGDQSVTVTVTVTIKVGSFTVTATYDITLMPEGADANHVTEVTWEQTGDYTFNLVDGTGTVSAKADGDIPGVTYALVDADGKDLGTILINHDSGTVAFSIDSATGVITAKMFGTIYVKAISIDVNDDGYNVESSLKAVTFYATKFYLDIDWSYDDCSGPASTSSSVNVQLYTWSEVQLTAGKAIVVLYEGLGSDWTSVIRSGGYLDSNSDNASGVRGGTNGNFTVSKTGLYNVSLDISGTQPSVKFEWVGEITSSDTFEMTVAIVGDGTSNWSTSENYYGSATATLDPSAGNLSITISNANFSGYTAWGKIGFITQKDGGNWSWYSDGVSQSVVSISGNKFSTSWSNSSNKWIGDSGTCQLGYNSSSTPTSCTFVFTFDTTGGLTAITIN